MKTKEKLILYNTSRLGMRLVDRYANLKKSIGRRIQGISGQDKLEKLAYIDIMKMCSEIEYGCYENIKYDIDQTIHKAANLVVDRPTRQDMLDLIVLFRNKMTENVEDRKSRKEKRIIDISTAQGITDKPELPDVTPDVDLPDVVPDVAINRVP